MTTKKKKTLKFTYLYEGDPDERTDTYVGEVKDGVMHGINNSENSILLMVGSRIM
ncbi:MAG: hypothetical protein QF864_02705 [SAR202 cluster bacterium]|jgi:hypothetical protein|nr:hypothetical protein [SAR202 cluster bacterium]